MLQKPSTSRIQQVHKETWVSIISFLNHVSACATVLWRQMHSSDGNHPAVSVNLNVRAPAIHLPCEVM